MKILKSHLFILEWLTAFDELACYRIQIGFPLDLKIIWIGFHFLREIKCYPYNPQKKKLTRWVWGLLGIRPVVCGVAVLFGQIYTMHAHFSFKKVESLFTIQRINLTATPCACPSQWNLPLWNRKTSGNSYSVKYSLMERGSTLLHVSFTIKQLLEYSLQKQNHAHY